MSDPKTCLCVLETDRMNPSAEGLCSMPEAVQAVCGHARGWWRVAQEQRGTLRRGCSCLGTPLLHLPPPPGPSKCASKRDFLAAGEKRTWRAKEQWPCLPAAIIL